ncbi:toll-like receptor 13 [Danio aesculapii]|uniref:toll-like receptor 13 n=1 Tax=Danio aesculapii TaxID=1142201 RepID=UPI0024C003B4|nr:toll-like receptor 13 [Danio aesculapii]
MKMAFLKMVLLFAFLLLFLKTYYVYSWLAGKCFVYGDVKEFPLTTYCPGNINGADCKHVTDIKEDLRGLPSNLLSVCIQMDRGCHGVLAPNSFSSFASLEHLTIVGGFSEIPAEAFNGLTNVTSLAISSSNPEKCCEVALDFSCLPSLTSLFISHYDLSLLAQNVFDKIPHLEKLHLGNVCLNNISEVLCRLANVKSLKQFTLESALHKLQHSNCSVFNTSDISAAFNIEKVHLKLTTVEHVDEGALKCFGKLFVFQFLVSNTDFLKDLSLIGVHKIRTLDFKMDVLNIADLCVAAKLYSIERIFVSYVMINLSVTPTNMSDGCKYIMSIALSNDLSEKIDNLLDVYSLFQIFSNLTTVTIQYHMLRSNDFQSLCASFPQAVKQLSVMILKNNKMEKIVSHQFMCFPNLETLKFVTSNIYGIEDFAFIGLNKLKELNLHSNKISSIHQHTFSGLHELMVLNLQANPIIHIEPESFGHFINLSSLLLGDLNFPPDMSLIKLNLSDIFGGIPYNLSNAFISSGLRPMHLVIGSNTTLTNGLNLHIKGQYVIVEDCNSLLLTSVITLQINAAYMICENEFIGKYVPSVVSLEFQSVFADNIGDLSVINQLVHLKTLKLENIDLTNQPNTAIMFHNLTKLQKMVLMNCKIYFLDKSVTKDLKALTSLVLIPKEAVNIIQNFVEHPTHLKYLHFQCFDLYCSCDNAWLVSWIRDNRKVEVVMSNPSMQDLQCFIGNEVDHLNFLSYVKENCSFDLEFVFFACSSVFLCIFIVVVLMYKFVGQYFKPFYHIASGWFREALRMKEKPQYRYDAFVSYSSKDEHWIIEELLPNLEQRGPPFLRLCLHSRDFQLGHDIVENITDSIYASRRTLCLVSRNYLDSNWCSLEMQLATYRLQVEHRDILILVFLETIPSRSLSSHHRLARLVKTRTYLDWPQDPEMHEAFWDRLWCKLSSNKAN